MPDDVLPERQFLSSKEVEAILGLSHSSVWRAAVSGQLAAVRIGKRLLFPRKAIEALALADVAPPRCEDEHPPAA